MSHPILVTLCTALILCLSSANGKPNVTVLIGDEFKFDFYYNFFRKFYRCLCNSATDHCSAFYSTSDKGNFITNVEIGESSKQPSKFYQCTAQNRMYGGIYCSKQTDMQKIKLYNYTSVTADYPGVSCDLKCIKLTGNSKQTVRIINNGNEGIQQCKVDDDDDDDDDDNDNTAIIIGVIVGFITTLAVVILGCVVWRRRQRCSRKWSLQNAQTLGQVETSGSLQVKEYETENILYEGTQAAAPMLTDGSKLTETHGQPQNHSDGIYSYAKEETHATAPMLTDGRKLTEAHGKPQNNKDGSYTYAVVGPKKGTTNVEVADVPYTPKAGDEFNNDEQVDSNSTKNTSDADNVYSRLH